MLVAIPPDSSLKRFIADLMLRMRVVRNGRSLPVSARQPRGATSGGPRSQQATAIGQLLQPRMPAGVLVISPGAGTVNQPRKGLSFRLKRAFPPATSAPHWG